jgi:preprotein translocase subunit SecG
MTVLPVLAVGILMNLVAVLFVAVCILLILVILIQKGRGGGLSGAFGGGMAGGLLGSKTGDFLTWVTITMVAVFLVLAVLLAMFYRPPEVGDYGAGQPTTRTEQPTRQPAPAEPVTEQPAPAPEPMEQPGDAGAGTGQGVDPAGG